jgi:hypothetical protein
MTDEFKALRLKRIEEWVEDCYWRYEPSALAVPLKMDGHQLAKAISHKLFNWETGKEKIRGQVVKRERSLMGCWCFANASGRQYLNIYRISSRAYEQRSNVLEFQYTKGS